MKAKLSIKNFGPIKDAELDLRQTTVFIGPQASGKSTIGKLLLLSRQILVKGTPPINLRSFFPDSFFRTIPMTLIEFKEYESLPFSSPRQKGYIKIDGFVSITNTLSSVENINNLIGIILLELEEGKKTKFADTEPLKSFIKRLKQTVDVLKESDLLDWPEDLSESFEEIVKEVVSSKITDNDFYRIQYFFSNLRKNNFSNSYSNIWYLPSERTFVSLASGSFLNLVNNAVPIPKTILDFGSEFEKARNKIKDFRIHFLNVEYRFENGEDKVFYGNKGEDFIKLQQSSSGQQNIVPMLMVIENNYSLEKGGSTFIIEEPELNLYPSAQKSLTYHLVNRCTRKENDRLFNDLVITTHSPYILTALNNLLFAYKVAQRHPEKKVEIAKIIPEESWLNPEDFNAYFVANGTVEQIFNRETGMISENELDSGSDEILEDFDALMEIYKLPAHA